MGLVEVKKGTLTSGTSPYPFLPKCPPGGGTDLDGRRGRAAEQGPFFNLLKSPTGVQNDKISRDSSDRVDIL